VVIVIIEVVMVAVSCNVGSFEEKVRGYGCYYLIAIKLLAVIADGLNAPEVLNEHLRSTLLRKHTSTGEDRAVR
jgi:hypothetical protein